jgi:HlyD family type I secretion membrane fusion protein
MSGEREFDLSDCTEFRQTLLARPPLLLRGTFLLLVGFLAAAVLWSAVTQADLVIRASGRVRPMIPLEQPPDAAAEESEVSPLRGGRVVEVHVREGDRVHLGDLLVRLETDRLETDLARQRQIIESAATELVRLDQIVVARKQRHQTAVAKAEAELAEAREAHQSAAQRRTAAIRLAEVDLKLAEDELQRLRQLAEMQVATRSQIVIAEGRAQSAQLKLDEAKLPVDEGRLLVAQSALPLVEQEHAVELAELEAQREVKRGQAATARLELEKLEWEHRQSELRAPSDGTVIACDVKVGDVIEAGRVVLAVAEQRGFRIDVTVASEDVGLIREGLPARIKLDAYDYQKYGTVTGRVSFVSPDSALPSQAIPPRPPAFTVRISLDGDQVGRGAHRGVIKLGMTGAAEIVTDRECILSLLLRSIRQHISLG